MEQFASERALSYELLGGRNQGVISGALLRTGVVPLQGLNQIIEGASSTLLLLSPAVLQHGLCCTMAAASWVWTLLGAQTFFSQFTELEKEGTKAFSISQDL